MVLRKFEYYEDKKKKTILLKPVHLYSTGLMFQRKCPPLLFTLPKEKNFAITSLFCKPFKAIFLDDKKRKIGEIKVSSWKWYVPCYGKYMIEILE
jgi:hypothetical protein